MRLLPTIFLLTAFLAITLAQKRAVAAPPGVPLISCFRCLSTEPRCTRTCVGRYCYKLELRIEDADGQPGKIPKVKSGCTNSTDAGLEVGDDGICQTQGSSLPGSSTKKSETMCLCQTEKCNSSPATR
ncbi:unnamed protein product, partial [Mesorhabditis spiculigera]